MATQVSNEVQAKDTAGTGSHVAIRIHRLTVDLYTALGEKIKKLCMVAVGRCCILKDLKTVGEFLSIKGSVEGEDGSKIGPIEFLVDTGSELFCLTESIFVRCKKELAGSRKIQGAHSQETRDVYKIAVFIDGEKHRVLVSHSPAYFPPL